MDEMKPGLRPDTIHVKKLPVAWFGGEKVKTSLLVQVFSTFGNIRRFHVPILDPLYASEFGRFSSKCLEFEAYIQYRDYIGFVEAMNGLRDKKVFNNWRRSLIINYFFLCFCSW